MHDLIFPPHQLQKMIPWVPCENCGAIRRPLKLYYPSVTVGDTHDILHFRMHCGSCNHYLPVEIRLERLRIGLLLLRAAEAAMRLPFAKRERYAIIDPGDDPEFDLHTAEYFHLLEAASSCGGLPTDWESMARDAEQWRDFNRRLGLNDCD